MTGVVRVCCCLCLSPLRPPFYSLGNLGTGPCLGGDSFLRCLQAAQNWQPPPPLVRLLLHGLEGVGGEGSVADTECILPGGCLRTQ